MKNWIEWKKGTVIFFTEKNTNKGQANKCKSVVWLCSSELTDISELQTYVGEEKIYPLEVQFICKTVWKQ